MQLLIFAVIFSFFVLYSPQPLLPMFANDYNISISQSALLITASIVPLSFAPFTYGFFLRNVSMVKILSFSLILLGLSSYIFTLAEEFYELMGMRILQGFIFPAVFTSVMTLISVSSNEENLGKNISFYISATIIGGLFARLLSGWVATYFDWKFFNYFLTVSLIIIGILVLQIGKDGKYKEPTQSKVDFKDIFFRSKNIYLFLWIFCLYFVFSGFLNFLPFRIKYLNSNASELFISLAYIGYIFGLISALFSQKISKFAGNDYNAILIGFILFALSLFIALTDNIVFLFLSIFVLCAGMFLVHSLSASLANKNCFKNKSTVNGIYVSFYYFGGVFGSFFPGLLYEVFGWKTFMFSLIFVVFLGIVILLLYKKSRVIY